MAATKSASADVKHVVSADGAHQIGVTIDKVFVPFVSLEGAYVASLVAAGKSPEAQAASGAPAEEEGE